MTQETIERIRRMAGANGQGNSAQTGPAKQAPSGLSVPAIVVAAKVHNTSISVPEIKALSNDRRGRREAQEGQRQLGQIALTATKFGVAIEAARAVNTFAVASFDRGQEEIMEVYYSKNRYPETNEAMGQVTALSIQQMAAQQLALAELHFKRLTEEL